MVLIILFKHPILSEKLILILIPSFEEAGEGILLFCCRSLHQWFPFLFHAESHILIWKAYRFIISLSRSRQGYVQTILELEKFQFYAVSAHFPQRFRGAQVFYKHHLFVLHCFFILDIKINFWLDHYKDWMTILSLTRTNEGLTSSWFQLHVCNKKNCLLLLFLHVFLNVSSYIWAMTKRFWSPHSVK